jgi:hypothetical protein
MTLLSAKWPSVVILAVLCCALGVPSPAAEPEEKEPALLKAKPLEPAKGDDELRKLQKERYNAALKEVQLRYEYVKAGKALALDVIADASRRLLDAELDLAEKPADRVAVYEKQLEFAKDVEKIIEARAAAGFRDFSAADVEQARYARLTAEVNLLRAKKDVPKSK